MESRRGLDRKYEEQTSGGLHRHSIDGSRTTHTQHKLCGFVANPYPLIRVLREAGECTSDVPVYMHRKTIIKRVLLSYSSILTWYTPEYMIHTIGKYIKRLVVWFWCQLLHTMTASTAALSAVVCGVIEVMNRRSVVSTALSYCCLYSSLRTNTAVLQLCTAALLQYPAAALLSISVESQHEQTLCSSSVSQRQKSCAMPNIGWRWKHNT